MLKKIAIGLSDVFFALKLFILFQKEMIESHSFSSVLGYLVQFGEVSGGKFSVIFVFGFENEAGRGVVSVGVNFVDIGLSETSGIKVFGVLDKFLFSLLSFELVKFKVVARVMFATFKPVMLRDFAMKIGLKFFKRFGVENIASRETTVGSDGNDADMNVRIGFVEVAVAVHDIFFSVVMLEKMEGVREIFFTFVCAEFKHEISRGTYDNVFKTDSVGTRFAFQVELLDT